MKQSGQTKQSLASTLMRGGLMRTLAFLANVIATLVVMPLLIEGLGTRTYGMWATIGSIVAYYGLLDLGLASTNEKFMAEALAKDDEEKARSIFSTSLMMFGAIGLFFLAVTFIIASSSAHFFPDPAEANLFRVAILILGANFALTFPFYAVEGALSAKLLFERVALARIISVIVRTGLVIYLMANGYSLIALSVAIVCTSLVYRTLLIHAIISKLPVARFSRSAVSTKALATLYHHGKYVFLGNISANAHFRLSNIIVGSILGLSAVTIYAVASRLSEYLNTLVQRLFSVLLPVFSSSNETMSKSEFDFIFWQTFQVNLIATATLFGLALILTKNFIFLWLGPGFDESHNLFIILAIGLALKQMQVSGLQALTAKSIHRQNNLLELAESVVAIVLAIYLGREFGLIGVTIGIIIPMIVNKVIFQPINLCKRLDLSLRRYYFTFISRTAPVLVVCMILWAATQGRHHLSMGDYITASGLISLPILFTGFLSLPRKIQARILRTAGNLISRIRPASSTPTPPDNTPQAASSIIPTILKRLEETQLLGTLKDEPHLLQDRQYGMLLTATISGEEERRIVIKIIKHPNGEEAAKRQAEVQMRAMTRLYAMTGGNARFTAPEPLIFWDDIPVIIMDHIEGSDLKNHFQDAPFFLDVKNFHDAGAALRDFHNNGTCQPKTMNATASLKALQDDLGKCRSDFSKTLVCRSGLGILNYLAMRVNNIKIPHSVLHGDYQSGNLIIVKRKPIAIIDPDTLAVGCVLDDVVTFLGHMDNYMLTPKGLGLIFVRWRLGKAFFRGYGFERNKNESVLYHFLALAFTLKFASHHIDKQSSIFHKLHFYVSIQMRVAYHATQLLTRSIGYANSTNKTPLVKF